MKKEPKPKRKYWYLLTIESCVLCGHETKYRERVYEEKLKGVNWTEKACGEHFI